MSRLPAAMLTFFCAIAVFSPAAQAGQCPRACKTTQQPQMIEATYSVADLVVPIDAPAKNPKTTEDALMSVLRHTVEPHTWEENGGAASVRYYPVGMALVVRQTPVNQQKVADLLTSLRRLQDVEVSVEVRFVSVSPDLAKIFMNLADFQTLNACDPRGAVQVAFMNDRQRGGWMQMLQHDRATNTMQVPKITVFNGQSGCIKIVDELEFLDSIDVSSSMPGCVPARAPEEVGLRVDVLPVVSADRRYVRLHLDLAYSTYIPAVAAKSAPTLTSAIQKLALAKVLVIPDGGTFACRVGTRLEETREVCETPLFCGILGDDLFSRNVTSGAAEQELFLLVTPRVIVIEANESPW
jgi:general secretion pathway protein D